MRRFYQTEWQNIPFSCFAETSSRQLAGPPFYDAFYSTLFHRYANYDALNADWRRNKDEQAAWLAGNIPDGARVLSIGCGLGYMEQRLWSHDGNRIDLHVQDFSTQALRWLREIMPGERIHGPSASEIFPASAGRFDVIYLSAVDYALPDAELVKLLISIRQRLSEKGELLMISASFLDESRSQAWIQSIKDVAKRLLERLGLYRMGQFWGWKRRGLEYQAIMRAAGFDQVTEGFIETPHQRTYWIKGKPSGEAKQR